VKTDGTGLTELPLPVLQPGSMIVPHFFITGPATFLDVGTVSKPGTPVNCPPDSDCNMINEVFVLSSDHVLQLTSFRRGDTGGNVNTDGQRVFFAASANPPKLGTNPSENCQIFSISVLADDLRQLTYFRAADHSEIGCYGGAGPGCFIYSGELIFDPATRTLVVATNCNPLRTNASGKQYFAMLSDGTGLRQLIATRGVVTAPDGSVDVELAGPVVYQGIFF
jgi:hypothetical protein